LASYSLKLVNIKITT